MIRSGFHLLLLPSWVQSRQGDGHSLFYPLHLCNRTSQPKAIAISWNFTFFFYILFIFRKIKHFLIAGLIRSFKRLLDYRRFSSRTWHIFSASYIQIDCLHNLSLWRNHKKIGILVLLSFFWRFVSLKNAFNVVITRNDILNESQN